MRIYLNIFPLIIVLSLISHFVEAQQRDSTIVVNDTQEQIDKLSEQAQEITSDTTLRNRPFKAALYSAALPGLGQIYNKQYWKLPIVYGLSAFMGFLLHRNYNLYVEFRDALFILSDDDPRTVLGEPLNRYSQNGIERGTELYRRNWELTIIVSAALYFIQIIDAHVDAHLREFVISDDLSFNLVPSTEQYLPGTRNYGLTMTITF